MSVHHISSAAFQLQRMSCKGHAKENLNNKAFFFFFLTQTPRTFCAANTEDLKFVLSHIHGIYPESPILAIGVSMGGYVFLK